MLNVMVVDDDYLVRQGFIRIMPWESFGMKVVCEASDGAEALTTLSRHAVDVLITDLAMPVMSGLELMKEAKERYPHLHMVVLTFHHEFDLVRDALRLGALDYITKVELEQDQMAVILQRIRDRIGQRTPPGQQNAEGGGARYFEDDAALAAFRTNGAEKEWSFVDAGGAPEGSPAEASDRHPMDVVRVRWTGVRGTEKKELLQRLRLYGEHALYYGWDEEARECELPSELLAEQRPPAKEETIRLGLDWCKLSWMTDPVVFDRLLEETARLRLPAAQLEQMFYMAIEEWAKVFDPESFRIDPAHRPHTWKGWTRWLSGVRRAVLSKADRQAYSLEVIACVTKAVDLVNQDVRAEIQLPDVAKKVGMSRSYFSRCFHDIVGVTFQEYIRDSRIRRAKTLLLSTNKSVGWIASESGYPNERYFSRVFRDVTGMLPREYRKQSAAHVTNRPK
ncbi:helix-turn-helix domain-containing protein [Paenibacillus sp.]|uniref:helix-turn-helix domain-containing protein n=1 Tax=Paenibacillus sp. TaxID=58172 RepID=UPI002812092F|nr:helix-turn-helix domain-containing protein [Paenibacillus sp.]